MGVADGLRDEKKSPPVWDSGTWGQMDSYETNRFLNTPRASNECIRKQAGWHSKMLYYLVDF